MKDCPSTTAGSHTGLTAASAEPAAEVARIASALASGLTLSAAPASVSDGPLAPPQAANTSDASSALPSNGKLFKDVFKEEHSDQRCWVLLVAARPWAFAIVI